MVVILPGVVLVFTSPCFQTTCVFYNQTKSLIAHTKIFFLRIRELSHQKVPNHIRKVNYLLPLFSLEKDQDFKLIDHESRKRNCQKTMYEDKLGRLFQSTHIPKTKGKRPT